MIQLNEIRIGNYLKNGFNQTIQIYGRISKYNTSGYQLKTLKPIPITEDELIKLGFVYNGYNFDYLNYNFHCQFKNENGEFKNTEFSIKKDERGKNKIVISYNIEYLHQLQNIYFSITNKELGYNE